MKMSLFNIALILNLKWSLNIIHYPIYFSINSNSLFNWPSSITDTFPNASECRGCQCGTRWDWWWGYVFSSLPEPRASSYSLTSSPQPTSATTSDKFPYSEQPPAAWLVSFTLSPSRTPASASIVFTWSSSPPLVSAAPPPSATTSSSESAYVTDSATACNDRSRDGTGCCRCSC